MRAPQNLEYLRGEAKRRRTKCFGTIASFILHMTKCVYQFSASLVYNFKRGQNRPYFL